MNIIDRIKTIFECRKELLLDCKLKIAFVAFQKQWRKVNPHNTSIAGCYFDVNKVSIGEGTYGTLNVHGWDNPKEFLRIGNYCSIADNVNFILGGLHPLHKITTFPYRSHILNLENTEPTGTKGPIIIEDDVWICYGVTVLSGVTIGKGSVIGAGSLVTKNIPPYSIVVNGMVKKYRFPREIVEKLIPIDLHQIMNIKDEKEKEKILLMDISKENVERIRDILS